MRDVVMPQTRNHAWTEIGERSCVSGSLQFMGRKNRRAGKGLAEKERSRGALILHWRARCRRGSGVSLFLPILFLPSSVIVASPG